VLNTMREIYVVHEIREALKKTKHIHLKQM